jgi:Do/DeqQ family serine protease
LLDDPFFRRFFQQEDPGIPRSRQENALGSGVIAGKRGYVLTNHHVIEGADEIVVALTDGRSARAKVIGTDPESDLALLKIDMHNLPVITFSDPAAPRVGDVVLAIGNPFGVGQTVTQGIVSATGRSRLGISTFENFIQTDAAINPGNSGGALVNNSGHLVGINTAIFSRSGASQGVGFAIPIGTVKMVMQQLIEHGYVIRGWLGVELQDLTAELAESFGLESQRGAVIAGVFPNSPAAKAGLLPGDVITHINELAITDATGMMNTIAAFPPGSHINLRFLHQGNETLAEASISERPQSNQ